MTHGQLGVNDFTVQTEKFLSHRGTSCISS